jgi:glycosyltransferase involved in cell wall biosynthesis
MKIVFFGDALAEHLRRWSKFFADRGHEVHVITWNSPVLEGYEPVVVHPLQKAVERRGLVARCVNLVRLKTAVGRLLAEIRPDLIHAHSAGAYAWVTMFTGFHPVVITPWGDDVLVNIRRPGLARFCTARSLRRADVVHCDGENTRQVLLGLGVAPERIAVVYFGTNVEKFAPAPPPEEFVRKYGLAGSKVVVSTRTLNPIHNVQTVVRAAPLVLKKAPSTKFLVVAGGAEEKTLHALAESLGVREAVVFTGRVEEQEMVTCLRAADLYVSTSLSESGLASSTAEAMACGLPVINTETGDIRVWIQDGQGGFVIPVESPEILADRILQLLENDQQRLRAGQLNRKTIEERYNVALEMRKIERIYLDLVARGPAK